MKRLVIAVAALVLSASASFAQDNQSKDIPFNVSAGKLSRYLELTAYQYEKVEVISDIFIQMQEESLNSGLRFKGKRMFEAVYGNLGLMRDALDKDQYRKYVALVNVTNNNKGAFGVTELIDTYLADAGTK